MDKMKLGEIDDALRQVAKHRDQRLGAPSPLAPSRRASLIGVLVRELPVESALCEAAKGRDQSLGSFPVEIPASVQSRLQRNLLKAQPTGSGIVGVSEWRAIFRARLRTVLTTCALIALAFLYLGTWGGLTGPGTARNVPQAAGANPEPAIILDRPSLGAELFNRKIAPGPFNLDTSEPASLEASFVANSRIELTAGMEMSAALRLDLPVKAVLLNELTRTP